MKAILEWNVETKTEYLDPRFLNTYITIFYYFLSNPHYLHCSTSDLYLVKNCWIDSKLLGCIEMSSFSKICPRSSYFFPNKDSSISQSSFRVFSPSRWNKISQEIWVHMKLKASSSRLKKNLLNMLLGLSFSTHSHHIHANIV